MCGGQGFHFCFLLLFQRQVGVAAVYRADQVRIHLKGLILDNTNNTVRLRNARSANDSATYYQIEQLQALQRLPEVQQIRVVLIEVFQAERVPCFREEKRLDQMSRLTQQTRPHLSTSSL